jgi:hypothetical protein
MGRRLLLLGLLLSVVLAVGCTMPNGAVLAPVMVTKSPVAIGDTKVGTDNVGEATVEGIILLARGDASIETAMRNGKPKPITRVHHVDSEELNVLGIYSTRTIRVYGE